MEPIDWFENVFTSETSDEETKVKGNAVPVNLAYEIAKSIKQQMEEL